MRPHGGGLRPNQKKAIALLIQGWRPSQIATALNVDRETIHRWRRDNEAFRAAMDEALEGFEVEGCAGLQQLVPRAIEEISGCLEDPRPEIRLGASKLVLDKWESLVQRRSDQEVIRLLESRLEQLQAQAQQTALAPAEEPVVEAEVLEVAPQIALDPEPEAKKPKRRKASQP